MSLMCPTAFQQTAAPVTSSKSIISTLVLEGRGQAISCVVQSRAGSADLSDFGIEIQGWNGGPWVGYLSGSDWSSNSIAIKLFVSNQQPNNLAESETSAFVVQISGAYAVRFWATTSSSTASIDLGGGVYGGSQ